MWRFRNGAKWRELPERFGHWSTVYGRFRQWRDAGVFTAVFQGAITEAAQRGLVDLSLVSVDSTTARAHHDAAGMIVEPATSGRAGEGRRGKRGASEEQDGQLDPQREERRRVRRRRKARLAAADLGRSRGGLTTKTHLSCVPQCLPLSLKITAGQAGDSPQFIPVLKRSSVPGPVGRPRTRPDAVAGDKAYSSRQNRSHLRETRHQSRHPRDEGPGRPPQEPRLTRRPARHLGQTAVQAPQHRRTHHQQDQGLARPRRPLRQTPRKLPGRTRVMRQPPLDPTPRIPTLITTPHRP